MTRLSAAPTLFGVFRSRWGLEVFLKSFSQFDLRLAVVCVGYFPFLYGSESRARRLLSKFEVLTFE